MKMRIEVREGPPSMFNPQANLYVVALHPDIGPADEETGAPIGEKVLGGPMTERNAIGMIETIRAGGIDKLLQEADEGEVDGVDLPPPPPQPEQPKPRLDLWIPLAYAVGIGAFVFVLIYVLGLR